MSDAYSIILLGIVIILQEIQIIRLQTKVHYIDRHRKSLLRGMELQSFINEGFSNLIEELMRDKFNMVNKK